MESLGLRHGGFVLTPSVAAIAGLLLCLPAPAGSAEGPPLKGFLQGSFKLSDPAAPAPRTRFKDAAGRNVSLGSFKGRVVLLNFWATWCAPCVEEMPSLDRLQTRLRNEGLAVVTVSVDREGASVVKPFLKKHRLTRLKAYLDPQHDLMDQFGNAGLPTTVLIDKQGRVVGKMSGGADWNSAAAIALIRYYLRPPSSLPDSVGSLQWANQADEDSAYEAYQRGDYGTAYSNWRPLAEAGEAEAQFNLAVLYDLGQGVAVDKARAATWYGRSAEQGLGAAQFNLAALFASGEGVARNSVLAYALFDLAAADDPEAAQQRDAEARGMSAEEIDSAVRLAERARDLGAASIFGDVLGIGAPSRALVRAVQEALSALGYDAGGADGRAGPKTRAAVRAFQADRAQSVDGEISQQLLTQLQAASN